MTISASAAHNRWHPELEPVAHAEPGELITLETRDGLDGQLTRESLHVDCATLDPGLGHPLTGPVFVEAPGPLGRILETDEIGGCNSVPGKPVGERDPPASCCRSTAAGRPESPPCPGSRY